MKLPDLNNLDIAFGNADHMPRYDDLPPEFQDWNHHPYCNAASTWFFRGASGTPQEFIIDGKKFIPRDGVDPSKALAAIKSVLGSFQPKHEHKIAACGYMLHEWFEMQEGN